MTRLRVEVIRDRCSGYANCVELAPHLFDLDEHDVAVVKVENVSTDEREILDRAVRRCPPDAIVVSEI